MNISILIPTLTEREVAYQRLRWNLDRQITEHGLEQRVEILTYLDNRENSIGFKRNDLVRRATGKFVAFIDDDDDVSPQYVSLIHQTILDNPDINCIELDQKTNWNAAINGLARLHIMRAALGLAG